MKNSKEVFQVKILLLPLNPADQEEGEVVAETSITSGRGDHYTTLGREEALDFYGAVVNAALDLLYQGAGETVEDS